MDTFKSEKKSEIDVPSESNAFKLIWRGHYWELYSKREWRVLRMIRAIYYDIYYGGSWSGNVFLFIQLELWEYEVIKGL